MASSGSQVLLYLLASEVGGVGVGGGVEERILEGVVEGGAAL